MAVPPGTHCHNLEAASFARQGAGIAGEQHGACIRCRHDYQTRPPAQPSRTRFGSWVLRSVAKLTSDRRGHRCVDSRRAGCVFCIFCIFASLMNSQTLGSPLPTSSDEPARGIGAGRWALGRALGGDHDPRTRKKEWSSTIEFVGFRARVRRSVDSLQAAGPGLPLATEKKQPPADPAAAYSMSTSRRPTKEQRRIPCNLIDISASAGIQSWMGWQAQELSGEVGWAGP